MNALISHKIKCIMRKEKKKISDVPFGNKLKLRIALNWQAGSIKCV